MRRYLGWVCLLCLCGPLGAIAQDDAGMAPAQDAGTDAGKPRPKPDAGKKAAPKAAPKKPGGCVDVSTEASFASVGYDHIVTLTSGCKKVMACTVKTDVNPEPASVQLEPGESQSVVTWRGSPARVFTPDVVCAPVR